MGSRYRQKVLWASSAPILSSSSSSPHSVSAIYPFRTLNSQGHASTNILTAGTDMRIRYWDLDQPNNSGILSFGATESSDRPTITYNKKIVDGSEVIEEMAPKKKNNSN